MASPDPLQPPVGDDDVTWHRPGSHKVPPPGDPLQPPMGDRDVTWHCPGSHKVPPPGDPLQPPVGDHDVTRHRQTLYNPRWETMT